MAAAPWQTCLITGASTGIGREIALRLAGEGVRVTAIARSADKLADLQSTSKNISVVTCDVANTTSCVAAMQAIAAGGSPDLVILNAGVWHPMGAAGFDAAKAAESMSVNYIGVTNCLAGLLPAMIARKQGHIALVGSVAGYRGLPKSVAYAPTKAALISLAESLQADLARYGLKITIINPGFVATPMTSINKFPMPYLMKVDDAAERIIRGLKAGKYEIAFPWQIVTMLKMARVAPNWAYLWFVRTFVLPAEERGSKDV